MSTNPLMFRSLVAIAACALAGFSAPVLAAGNFPVELQNPATQESCSLIGSMLQVDPVTGKVDIVLAQDPECGAPVVPGSPIPTTLATWAKLEVVGGTSVGGGTTGEGTVSLKLTTGLTEATPGVICEADGQTESQVSVVSGWTGTLCTSCGSTATSNVVVKNTGATGNGTITFKAKCSVQDPVHGNLSSVVKNIVSTPSVTVIPGTAPPAPSYCSSVNELSNNYGLTEAMRQTVGKVTQGLIRGDAIDMTKFNSVFGALTNVAAPGDPNAVDFGFPGRDVNNTEIYPKRNMYISLRFRAPNAPAWISPAHFGSIQSSQTGVAYLTSIAPCPGQFHSEAAHPMVGTCSRYSGESSFGWTLGTTGSACKLQPGDTYYLNVITAHPDSLTVSGCTTAECKQKIASYHTYPIQ